MSSKTEKLRLVILGAGGIGCYYGARLIVQQQAVTFIARGEHLAALKNKGLLLKHPEFEFNQPVTACDMAEFTERFTPDEIDAVIVCVKATATVDVASQLQHWFAANNSQTAVISLQNGIDNEQQLLAALGESVVIGGLAVRIGGHIVRPGVVEATGIAQIVLGAWPYRGSPADTRYSQRVLRLVAVFNEAHIPARKVDNIRYELWKKLVINNGVNPLSALTRLDTYCLSHHAELGPLVRAMMQETASAAKADDEVLTEKDVNDMFELIRNFDPIKTSMLVDLEKGRQLEIDAISGAVLQRSQKLGISAPVTQTVYALLKHMIEK